MNPKLSIRVGVAIVAALALAAVARRAESQSAGLPGEWLAQYASARTLGLGNAFVATANDPFGVLWNPAGLSSMDQNEFRFETARLFEDTAIHGASFAVPGSRLPSMGVTVLALRSGDFQRTNDLNDDLGDFHEGETAYLFTVSRAFATRFAIGASAKYVQQTIEEFSGGGFGADLGATFVVVSHDLSSIFTIADNSVFLDRVTCTMRAQGKPSELLKHSTDPAVRQFLTRGDSGAAH